MTNREALAAALADDVVGHVLDLTAAVAQEFGDDDMDDVWLKRVQVIEAAARERLAQLENDSLIIEKVNGTWPDWAANGTWEATSRTLDALLLASREGA